MSHTEVRLLAPHSVEPATIMISLASFLLALVAAPPSTHGLAPLDTTALFAKPLAADTAAAA